MSLQEAILDIVEEMYAEAEDLKGDADAPSAYLHDTLKGYARALRSACKSAGNESSVERTIAQTLASPQAQHVSEVDRFRAEIRRQKGGSIGSSILVSPTGAKVEMEEKYTGDYVQVEGGPACPDETPVVHPIDPSMPIGAFTELVGAIYQLKNTPSGRRLVHTPDYGKNTQTPKIIGA